MRVNVAREHCQNDPCDLVVTCRLTNYVDLVKEEGESNNFEEDNEGELEDDFEVYNYEEGD